MARRIREQGTARAREDGQLVGFPKAENASSILVAHSLQRSSSVTFLTPINHRGERTLEQELSHSCLFVQRTNHNMRAFSGAYSEHDPRIS
jgi:hypothetical protein